MRASLRSEQDRLSDIDDSSRLPAGFDYDRTTPDILRQLSGARRAEILKELGLSPRVIGQLAPHPPPPRSVHASPKSPMFKSLVERQRKMKAKKFGRRKRFPPGGVISLEQMDGGLNPPSSVEDEGDVEYNDGEGVPVDSSGGGGGGRRSPEDGEYRMTSPPRYESMVDDAPDRPIPREKQMILMETSTIEEKKVDGSGKSKDRDEGTRGKKPEIEFVEDDWSAYSYSPRYHLKRAAAPPSKSMLTSLPRSKDRHGLPDGRISSSLGLWRPRLDTPQLGEPKEPTSINPSYISEKAVKYEYCVESDRWKKRVVDIWVDDKPFSSGAMRRSFRIREVHPDGTVGALMVGKHGAKPSTDLREFYFEDVKTQTCARFWAQEFNRRMGDGKKVDFLPCNVFELISRDTRPLMGVEPLVVGGRFEKHNSNTGYVLRVDGRDAAVPQAFSHFTFEASGGALIVVDIQGVGNIWTDPQIHSITGLGFGRGNLGAKGIVAFLSTHECNPLCKKLGLYPIDHRDIRRNQKKSGPEMTIKKMTARLERSRTRGPKLSESSLRLFRGVTEEPGTPTGKGRPMSESRRSSSPTGSSATSIAYRLKSSGHSGFASMRKEEERSMRHRIHMLERMIHEVVGTEEERVVKSEEERDLVQYMQHRRPTAPTNARSPRHTPRRWYDEISHLSQSSRDLMADFRKQEKEVDQELYNLDHTISFVRESARILSNPPSAPSPHHE
jgi:hypothetical protein